MIQKTVNIIQWVLCFSPLYFYKNSPLLKYWAGGWIKIEYENSLDKQIYQYGYY
jgi:hypothetical protein